MESRTGNARGREGGEAKTMGKINYPSKSAPVQKARPDPVMTAQRSAGSRSYHFHKASSSWLPVVSMQLRSSGRLSVINKIWVLGKVTIARDTRGCSENTWFDMIEDEIRNVKGRIPRHEECQGLS